MQTSKEYFPIRKSKVYFETAGRGDPALLLHGGFGSNDDFASQIPKLARHFKVVAFERPGHGHTKDTDEPFSFSIMSGYTVDFIKSLNLGPVNLIGWSDGAIISLYVALSRPDLVKRIVSIGGSFDAKAQPADAVEWIRRLTPDLFRKTMPLLANRYDRVSPDGPGHFPVILEKTKRLWLLEPNLSPSDLAKITAPTLVMAGDRDAVTAEHTLELFRSIKKSELCIIPGATHFLLSEKPEVANRVIIDFLVKKN